MFNASAGGDNPPVLSSPVPDNPVFKGELVPDPGGLAKRINASRAPAPHLRGGGSGGSAAGTGRWSDTAWGCDRLPPPRRHLQIAHCAASVRPESKPGKVHPHLPNTPGVSLCVQKDTPCQCRVLEGVTVHVTDPWLCHRCVLSTSTCHHTWLTPLDVLPRVSCS